MGKTNDKEALSPQHSMSQILPEIILRLDNEEVFSDAPWGMFSGRWVLQGDFTPHEVSSVSPNSTEDEMCVQLAGSTAASRTA